MCLTVKLDSKEANLLGCLVSKTIDPGEKLGTFLESSLNFLQEKRESVGGQSYKIGLRFL
ncbi:hypothetical protein BpHYR1_015840 [Brachionus plicatilis]|uniref:Uncharacterized protein n=1 Tax=Brachionus plicatilis TaxID=10195 RepID=A0A3M7RIU2_BRAPC|nr:hypothetical protein BpHYR1_015840 [Brachionus plicatilis]